MQRFCNGSFFTLADIGHIFVGVLNAKLMRYLLRISILTIIMTLTCATASADKYSRAWKKVDELIKKDQPQSAAREITAIWDMAAKDNESRQMLKSAVYLTQVQQTYAENSVTDGIELFKTLLPTLKVREHRALCHAFLAKGYQGYLSYNRYNIQRQPQTDMENPPIDRWTLKMITDTICYHLNQSIEEAGDVASGYYEEFFPGGNKAGMKLRPSLVDLLMDNAVTEMTSSRLIRSKRKFLDDGRLYGSALQYLEATYDLGPDDPDFWPLYVLKRLTQHNLTSKPDIRATVDLRRMNVLKDYLSRNGDEDWSGNEEAWVNGCLDLAGSYEKKVKFSTMFYYAAASLIDTYESRFSDGNDPETESRLRRMKHDICLRSLKKWPKSEGAINCLAMLYQMEMPSVSLSHQGDLAPGERNLALATYRNASTLYFKLVEVTGEDPNNVHDNTELMDYLSSIQPTLEWSMRVNDPGDWMDHYALVDIAPVMQGNYYLVASTGSSFRQQDAISLTYLECNGVGLAHSVARNGAISAYTVDLKTGKPIGSCRYMLWHTNYNNDLIKVYTQGFSDEDGFISIEGIPGGSYRMEMDKGGKKGHQDFYISTITDMPDRNYGRLYTDRFTYLPGDSVEFMGVAYFSDGYERGHVLKDYQVRITVYDVNYRRINEFTCITDSAGVVRGGFRLPENILPGRMTIRMYGTENGFQTSRQINVESFKQPKFDISLDRIEQELVFDHEIEVTGQAVSFTDVPVDGADVRWYATVSPDYLHPFCVRDESGQVSIGSGELKTDKDGRFSIGLVVPSENLIRDNCRVELRVTVTDLNGETHDRITTFFMGGDLSIGLVDKAVYDQSAVGLDLRVSLHKSQPVKGDVHIEVTRVSASPYKIPLPFGLVRGKRQVAELSKIIDDQNVRERFERYDFDFIKQLDAVETVCDEMVQVSALNGADVKLRGLKSGVYRIVATSGTARSEVLKVLVENDDSTFVPFTDYLWVGAPVEAKAEVGDTVRLRVASCLPGVTVHYFVENRFGMCRRGSLNLNGKQQTLSIPVTDDMKGMFSIGLGMVHDGYTANRNLSFEVEDRKKQLDMELVTFRDMIEPDSDEEWKIRVTDKAGNPVTAAIMMDMYDSALDKYGSNEWFFMPWYSVFVSSSNIFREPWRHAEQLTPPYTRSFEYKGKYAVTGNLINPFVYSRPVTVSLRKNASGVASIDMEEFEGLGITTVDQALQGRIAGLDIVFDSGDLGARSTMNLRGASQNAAMDLATEGDLDMIDEDDLEEAGNVVLRTDMNPTGLFEYLMTDANGMASVRFKAPQLLTRWKVQGFTFDDSLRTGSIEECYVVTRKLIMIEPSAPRFLREGDRMEFTFKVSNLTEGAVKAKVTVSFTDAETGKPVKMVEGASAKTISIPGGGSAGAGFTVNVPSGLKAVTYRITAQATGHSDGIQETIPVLTNRTRVVQALSLFNNGNETRTFRFTELEGKRTATMADEQLTVEYTATPIWYAIQSLPSLIRLDNPSNLSLFYQFMGSSISFDLNRRYPAIRKMLDEWAEIPASEWQTQLERNTKLTGTLLEETPYLFDSKGERMRLSHLARVLGTEEMQKTLTASLERLKGSQQSDGGWPWMDGFRTDTRVTGEILTGLGLLIENGIVEVTPDLENMIGRGLDYLDAYYYDEYDKKEKPRNLGIEELTYLITRSYFVHYPFKGATKESHDYFTRLAETEDTHEMDVYRRTQMGLLMARRGKLDEARNIAGTLLERSLYSDEMGRYWRDNTGGLWASESVIEMQSMIIRLLLATDYRNEAIESARWLLKQKQTTGWSSSPATAAAVVALMATGGNTQLESDPDITIYVGKEALKASDSKANAGYTTRTWDSPISSDKAKVTVESKTDGVSWGAIYRSFTEEMDKVEHSENGITLKRTVWRVTDGPDGERLEEVKPGRKLRVGDRLKIQFDVTLDRNLEYLELSDMRAATMEPLSTRGGYTYNWRDGIGYYSAPGNTRNVFYIDRLSKGSYRMEYEVHVRKPGRFQEGIAVMQCLYAPAFRATTSSAVITVE